MSKITTQTEFVFINTIHQMCIIFKQKSTHQMKVKLAISCLRFCKSLYIGLVGKNKKFDSEINNFIKDINDLKKENNG